VIIVDDLTRPTPAHRVLPPLLRNMRESAGMTQRDLGKKLKKPQSWIYNCESANRRVDVTEFVLWCRACGADPLNEFGNVIEKIR